MLQPAASPEPEVASPPSAWRRMLHRAAPARGPLERSQQPRYSPAELNLLATQGQGWGRADEGKVGIALFGSADNQLRFLSDCVPFTALSQPLSGHHGASSVLLILHWNFGGIKTYHNTL